MAVRSKRFEYRASVDPDGTMRTGGEGAVTVPPPWRADDLLMAAITKCSLSSLRHHAERAGLALEGGGAARGVVARREEDGRFAMVEVDVDLDVRLDPLPCVDDVRELLDKAERDCFVGASLRVRPHYSWTVNGVPLEGDAEAA